MSVRMQTRAPARHRSTSGRRSGPARARAGAARGRAVPPSSAVRLLQVFALALMVLPSDHVVKVIGADGYAAALVAYLMFFLWAAASLLGHHDPFACRYPTRLTLAGMWVCSLASYLVINRASITAEQSAAADRWLIQLLEMSAIILVAAEGLRTLEDVRRVLRPLIWGGTVCGIIAGLQFKARIDLTRNLKLPGFGINSAAASTAQIVERGTQNRVPGTGIDPIEMGVAMAMLLALAIYLLMHDHDRPRWQRTVPVLCIAFGTAASVSRSAIIALVLAVGGLIFSLTPTRRLKGLTGLVLAVVALALVAPGLIETLLSFFLKAKTDPSVTHRTNNYPYVLHLVQRAPWLGQGGGTYIPPFGTNTLDNEYLDIVIELGLLGLAATICYLVYPAITAFAARRRTDNPELRDLCAALGAAELAAVVTSGTFDSFSFPMFYDLQALLAGLASAVWLIVRNETKFLRALKRKIMNLFTIAGSLWRHKWAALPVILLTAAAMIYTVALKPAAYQATAFVLLESPPQGPTIGQIELDPKLARIDANNALASVGNLTQVADVLAQMAGSPVSTALLRQEGAIAGYSVAPDSSVDTPPVIDVVGVGPTPAKAIRSTQLVVNDIQQELYHLQAEQRINKSYFIPSIEYVRPTTATSSSSSKVRSAAVIAIIGLLLLLVVVSVAQSVEERRGQARHQREKPAPEPAERYRADSEPSLNYDRAQARPVPASRAPHS